MHSLVTAPPSLGPLIDCSSVCLSFALCAAPTASNQTERSPPPPPAPHFYKSFVCESVEKPVNDFIVFHLSSKAAEYIDMQSMDAWHMDQYR